MANLLTLEAVAYKDVPIPLEMLRLSLYLHHSLSLVLGKGQQSCTLPRFSLLLP